MNWRDWIGKRVFIELIGGNIYTRSKVIDFDDPFLTIEDKFGRRVQINIRQIARIGETEDEKRQN